MKESFRVVEELARVEQRLAAKDGRKISLKATESFRELKPEEKINFGFYEKRKGRGKKILYSLIALSFIFLFLTQTGITGQIVGISEAGKTTSFLKILAIIFLVFLLIIFLFSSITDRIISKRFEGHLKVAEKYF